MSHQVIAISPAKLKAFVETASTEVREQIKKNCGRIGTGAEMMIEVNVYPEMTFGAALAEAAK